MGIKISKNRKQIQSWMGREEVMYQEEVVGEVSVIKTLFKFSEN